MSPSCLDVAVIRSQIYRSSFTPVIRQLRRDLTDKTSWKFNEPFLLLSLDVNVALRLHRAFTALAKSMYNPLPSLKFSVGKC